MRVGLVVGALCAGFLVAGCGGASPSSLEFVDISPAEPRLGQITTVRFKATDSRGTPMAGAEVAFRLQTDKPGVTLSPLPAVVSTNKGDGMAAIQLTATARVSSVVIEAKSGDKIVFSPPISFAGTVPSAKQFTFQCGAIAGKASGGVHAIGAYDETRYLIAGSKLECFAFVGDRNGEAVPNALVSFMAEAGSISPTDTTVAEGNAKAEYRTSYPLPLDVPPGVFTWNPAKDAVHTGEYIAPLWMHPFLWIGNPILQYASIPNLNEPRRQDPVRKALNLTLNPRDNLVTMIAITTGEEAFDDTNNNGKYDQGEGFDDLTEPFVDSNDNGTWDEGERYVDTNGNGKWDGKNGVYDASTLIWVPERILWTGMPHGLDARTPEPTMAMIAPNPPPNIAHYGFVDGLVLLSDPWFNTMAQNGDGDGCHSSDAAEKPMVVMSPTTTNAGALFTYPSPMTVGFRIKDAHDPLASPPDPAYSTPMQFMLPVTCKSTSSPVEGYVTNLTMFIIYGTVL